MTTAAAQPQQAEEIQRLRKELERIQTEIAAIQTELAQVQARIAAQNQHTFTLTFAGGQVALLEIRGASDQEAARTLAKAAFTNCTYKIRDGDHTGGHAAIFYQWCSAAAQGCQPLYMRSQREAAQ